MYEMAVQNGFRDESGGHAFYDRRNSGERRKKTSPGFTCITVVGWICRREQVRRRDDPPVFAGQDK